MAYVKKFKEPATSDSTIRERAAKKGFTVIRIDRSKKVPYVLMKCAKGHLKGCPATTIHRDSTICAICDGKRFDLPKVEELLSKEGYTIRSAPELEEDRYGNKVVKAAKRFVVTCPNGHVQSLNLTEFIKGKRCTTCSGTIFNTGFSRSEEIIARVLEYIGVPFERHHSTGEEYENLPLDFYLPSLKMIIEYDGAQHKYGRSSSTKEQLEDIQRRDRIKNDFARHIGFKMVRISAEEGGKSLVYYLADVLKDYVSIDVRDPYYDEIVREVFNECADRFGWLTYEEIKHNADLRLIYTLPKVHEMTGSPTSVIARHFKWVYGMTKREYTKNTRVAR